VQIPKRGCAKVGYPNTIRVDSGSEFIARDFDLRSYAGVTLDLSTPGKPTDEGVIESFTSKTRAECQNAHWFMSLAGAREKLEESLRGLNEIRWTCPENVESTN
jgi:putative transposase